MEHAISLNFGLEPRGKAHKESPYMTTDRYERVMATAGGYVRGLRVEVMAAHNDHQHSSDVRMRLLTFFNDVTKEFAKTVGYLERAFRAVEKGPRAEQSRKIEDLLTLAYVVEPKDYEDIALYMESEVS